VVVLPALPLSSERTRGMVFVPARTYALGPPGHQCVRRALEEKKLGRPFAIDRTEVTCGAFRRFVEERGYARRELWSDAGRAWLDERLRAGPLDGPLDVDLSAAGRDALPVTGVSLFEAEAFARWAGKELPGNDEWEIAARGSLSSAFPWGQKYAPEFFVPGRSAPAATGQLALDASPFGCVDLAGNVREWTRDHRRDHLGHEIPERIVVKGGAWLDGPKEAELLARAAAAWDRDPRTRAPDIGFRCMRWLGPEDFRPGE
jgi:formylglycine-generating enzyme required for sulfatase activity